MNKPQLTATRLKQAREELGISQEELGRRYGSSGAHISQIERGKRGIGLKSLQRLADVLGKPIEWFISSEEITPSRPLYAIISEFERATERLEVMEIPVIGTISGDYPSLIGETKEEYVTVPKEMLGAARNHKNIYALRIDDDTMNGDGILPGDTVVLDPEAAIIDGKIYALRRGKEVMVRHIHRMKDALRLSRSDGSHQDIATGEITIIGRVILSFRQH
jgi:SOS-response transcriptional repressor LexA